MPEWFDSHCHLEAGEAASAAVVQARAAGVERMVTVGCDLATSLEAISVAGAHDGVWATVGVHPHDAKDGLDGIVALLDSPKVVAVGECGLDYHYDHSPRDVQRSVFAEQVALAHERAMALVIHTREAWDDTFDILAVEGVPEHAVFHCFTGGPDEARRGLDMGLSISFSGIVTFKNAGDVREAAALCPADRILVETDSPYLAPVPHRGKPNVPANVALVGAMVAEVRGESVEEVARSTWRNTLRLFGLE